MNKREVYKALGEGHKVRHLCWSPGEYLKLDDNGFLVNHLGCKGNLNVIQNSDWEIYHEPKNKVKMWQWLLRDRSDLRPSYYDYKNLEKAESDCCNSAVIQRLDHTEIEVEVDDE